MFQHQAPIPVHQGHANRKSPLHVVDAPPVQPLPCLKIRPGLLRQHGHQGLQFLSLRQFPRFHIIRIGLEVPIFLRIHHIIMSGKDNGP